MHPVCLLCKIQYTEEAQAVHSPLALPCGRLTLHLPFSSLPLTRMFRPGHIMCQACVNTSSARRDKCPLRCTESPINAAEAMPISFSVEASPGSSLEERVAKSVVHILMSHRILSHPVDVSQR